MIIIIIYNFEHGTLALIYIYVCGCVCVCISIEWIIDVCIHCMLATGTEFYVKIMFVENINT